MFIPYMQKFVFCLLEKKHPVSSQSRSYQIIFPCTIIIFITSLFFPTLSLDSSSVIIYYYQIIIQGSNLVIQISKASDCFPLFRNRLFYADSFVMVFFHYCQTLLSSLLKSEKNLIKSWQMFSHFSIQVPLFLSVTCSQQHQNIRVVFL